MASACAVRVRGIVQGVGFRPYVFGLARRNTLAGWVLNTADGVHMHLEGEDEALRAFLRDLEHAPPHAAVITAVEIETALPEGLADFVIRDSQGGERPTAPIAPDLPVCDDCLRELADPGDRRFGYPYINCTNCGPRYSLITALPYDRPHTTLKEWPLDEACRAEYDDPANRRFHAEAIACSECGPRYVLHESAEADASTNVIARAAERLRAGRILAVKGIGGYHLVCDAHNRAAVEALRRRKYRKEKPFALMVPDLDTARRVVHLSSAAEALLLSPARPIVLAPARQILPGVAPDTTELGVMLAYAPLHHLLYAHGAPPVLVMTSANRSSEPMAYEDDDARQALTGIADGFLVGQRPIARRVDDSIVRAGAWGVTILRRSRGYAPEVVASVPFPRPLLAVGADLKNAVTLVVAGQAMVSQHIGDLAHYGARLAFEQTIRDLLAMYHLGWDDLRVVHDAHPEYVSTAFAVERFAHAHAVQHHRAHVASVVAERGAWSRRVIGVSLDGTGYGDDGTIWGGEFFAGSVEAGLRRVAHLRPAALIGGDQAARHPVQAAAGFVAQLDDLPDLDRDPFGFPERYHQARGLLAAGVRVCPTTSFGRLFDTAAALLGFTRETTFEGQAAMWLEHLATETAEVEGYPFPFVEGELDFRPLLHAVVHDRAAGRPVSAIAAAFHEGVAQGLSDGMTTLCETHGTSTVACSGGVFQNERLCAAIHRRLHKKGLEMWTNHRVPCNDGGLSLGQAALAAFGDARAALT